ncbi:MAG: type II toxin-antitoxin system Phd/YefM family antitoxin [Actinobacteria bacterium]|nr:type II toxin-antitoxin system Phd/YefM family antitoxin [Actinomycetota bacterium]
MIERKPMLHTIKASEARTNFGQVLKRVHRCDERIIIEKGGLSVAAIIGIDDLEKLTQLEKLEHFEYFTRALGKEAERRGITEEQLIEDMEKTKQKVFEEQYGRAIRQKTS